MKTKMKALALALCAVMLVATTVFATVAFLTSTTGVVTNTFSVGNVKITLDETDVDIYGVKDGDTRVTENSYKLIPNHSYTKDPIVHVDPNSEPCWIFVKVVNDIAAIEDATTVADQMTSNGWTLVNGQTNVYAYENIVGATSDSKKVEIPVFASFKIKSSETDLSSYTGKTITVQAYAIQADGFATAEAAWTAAPTAWN